jgi:Zn-dependent peptidase ImmA (M78 family)/transcriptional regulator with XRE-family HTH domain
MTPSNSLHSVAYQFNPDCLKVAREYRGLKKNELAGKLDITPSAVSQFESGQVRPTPQTIAHLSMALRFPPAFFSKKNLVRAIPPDQCHFRSLRSCSQIERRKMVGAGSLIGIIIDFIENHVDLPQEDVTSATSYGAETTGEIEEAALTVRRNWGLGLGPIDNIVHLLESKGVLLFRLLEDCKKLDAFSLWYRHRPFIFLNSEKDSASRNIFDAAHELGHIVLHSEYLPGDQKQEDEANKFASAFLMPRESFLLECPRRLVWDHYRELKQRWRVSLAALVRRARDLQLISNDTYRRAHVQLNKRGWRYNEPDEPEMEHPTVLPQAVELLDQLGWSLPSIAQHLSLSETDLRWLIYADTEQVDASDAARPLAVEQQVPREGT